MYLDFKVKIPSDSSGITGKNIFFYNSTNKNGQAGDINFVEYRHFKEDICAPVINYCFFEVMRFLNGKEVCDE